MICCVNIYDGLTILAASGILRLLSREMKIYTLVMVSIRQFKIPIKNQNLMYKNQWSYSKSVFSTVIGRKKTLVKAKITNVKSHVFDKKSQISGISKNSVLCQSIQFFHLL